jgi:hypothetical protein
MRKTSTSLPLALGLALLAGCSPSDSSSSSNTGSAHLVVSARQTLTVAISRITVTSSAEDVPSATVDLTLTDGVWGGTIGNIPAGWGRTFLGRAFDAEGTLLYEGTASDVYISEGQAVLVALSLVDVNAPSPFSNEAPIIDSLVASALSVTAGGTLTLQASAHDPNPGERLRYSWSSVDGVFTPAQASTTTWVAPSSDGVHGLKLTVTDSLGLSSSVTVKVTVQGGGRGEVQPSISFNSWPVVSHVTATSALLAVGQPASVSALVSDPDGDVLSYAWSATCEGSWDNASSIMAQFTPTAQPSGVCNNCSLTVTVSDGQGGQTTGTVALCIGGVSPTIPPSAPYIVRSYSSSNTASANQLLNFEVVAKDPQGSALGFSWAASAGSLGVATDGTLNSRITWTAPACIAEDMDPVLTATVTNTLNMVDTRSFVITGVPACSYAWASTGAMATARTSATATLLPNGKVLVAGGRNYYYYSNYLTTAELYEPATGAWSATGAMASPRNEYTATLLPNGKVLVVGGFNDYTTLATAEVYNPVTGTWSATGAMATARSAHTATLLPNGKVLVVGGRFGNATAELYDPATGTWSTTGSMASGRSAHTATLLPNGKVLVAGGEAGYYSTQATAELYDPATGTWSATGSMTTARNSPTATLLPNGKVLVAGGYNYNYYSNTLATAELYDPATGAWSATGSMSWARYLHTAALLPNGEVLVVGGVGASSSSLRKTELYNPATGTWRTHGSVWSGRYSHTATLLPNGKVLAAGGYSSETGYLSAAELYTP